jgi:phospho-N-acetylmuramoyl-pentapeptide-transferase
MIQYLDHLLPFDLTGNPALRALMAALSAFVLVLVGARWLIRVLTERRVLERSRKGDSERLDEMHSDKERTPTMGGLVLVGSALVATVAWGRLDSRLLLLLVGYACALGLLGFLDDLTKLRSGRKGLRARTKLLVQLAVSLLVGGCLYLSPLEVEFPAAGGNAGTCVFFPFFKDHYIQLGVGFVLLVTCVTTGAFNAVNLTDGLDGLATGCSLLVGATLVAVAFLCGNPLSSSVLHIPYVVHGHEVAVFLAALLGGGLGFLWFNCHPAQIFMGDTGALPLGGSLGLAAVMLKQEMLLVLVGGVLVVEVLSVVLQVFSFKVWRKRVFLCAPLHHHFQFKGWPETKVTVRFWIAGAMLALFSLVTFS